MQNKNRMKYRGKPLVSMIIPCYNAEKTIRACLDSVAAQDYKNLEILVIDDGSADTSRAIIQSYEKKDKRIHLISIAHQGVSAARNLGMCRAGGTYLQFVDADDVLFPGCTGKLVNEMERQNADWVICNYRQLGETGEELDPNHVHLKGGRYSRRKFLKKITACPGAHFYGVLWNKLYRADVIRKQKLCFPEEVSMGEDFIFNMNYLAQIQRINCLNEKLYDYCVRAGSLSNEDRREERKIAERVRMYEAYRELFSRLRLFGRWRYRMLFYMIKFYFDELDALGEEAERYRKLLYQTVIAGCGIHRIEFLGYLCLKKGKRLFHIGKKGKRLFRIGKKRKRLLDLNVKKMPQKKQKEKNGNHTVLGLISVIVPVYNVENYLFDCVSSILAQSNPDFELILVDDGSSDQSGTLCDDWQKQDARIRVIHQKNQGLSAARNRGMQEARGEYLCFVDADDWIEPDYLRILYENLIAFHADVSCCCYRICSGRETIIDNQDRIKETANAEGTGIVEETKNVKKTETVEEIENVKGKKVVRYHASDLWNLLTPVGPDCQNTWLVVAWNKLIRKEILKDLTFPTGKWHEDEFFVHRLLTRMDHMVFTDEVLYCYRKRAESISGGDNRMNEKHLDLIDAWEERVCFCKRQKICYPEMVTSYRQTIINQYYDFHRGKTAFFLKLRFLGSFFRYPVVEKRLWKCYLLFLVRAKWYYKIYWDESL